MHCHIDSHLITGMALMLNESFEYQNRYIPKGLPTCHSYLKPPTEVVQAVSSEKRSSTGMQTLFQLFLKTPLATAIV